MAGLVGLIDDLSNRIIFHDLDLFSRILFALTSKANYNQYFFKSSQRTKEKDISPLDIILAALVYGTASLVEYTLVELLGNPSLPLKQSGKPFFGPLALIPMLDFLPLNETPNLDSLLCSLTVLAWPPKADLPIGYLRCHLGLAASIDKLETVERVFKQARYRKKPLKYFWLGAAAGGFMRDFRRLPSSMQATCCRSPSYDLTFSLCSTREYRTYDH